MKITLKQVIENSTYIQPGTGEKRLVYNLEKMKNWKKSRIEYFFDENDKLISNPSKDAKDEYKLIANSRKYVRKSLQTIIKDAKKKDDKLKPNIGIYGKLTSQLISKENIMGKFKNAEVELNSEENE